MRAFFQCVAQVTGPHPNPLPQAGEGAKIADAHDWSAESLRGNDIAAGGMPIAYRATRADPVCAEFPHTRARSLKFSARALRYV
jgi:hypothetical protein